jgi:hypothetical protein
MYMQPLQLCNTVACDSRDKAHVIIIATRSDPRSSRAIDKRISESVDLSYGRSNGVLANQRSVRDAWEHTVSDEFGFRTLCMMAVTHNTRHDVEMPWQLLSMFLF